MSLLKGSGWLINFEFVKKTFGEEAHNKIIEQLSPADQAELKKTMIAATWGPDFSIFMRYIKLVDKVYGKGDLAVLKQAASNHLKRDLGLYTLFFKVLKPAMVINNMPKLWRTYFNPPGTVTVEHLSEKHFQVKLTGFENMVADHEIYHGAYIEEVLKQYKFNNPVLSHPKCLARGDDHCLFDVHY